MSTSDQALTECPSWTNLARFVEEGGPWPVAHLSNCSTCRQRRLFLESLSSLADTSGGGAVVGEHCPDLLEIATLVDGNVERPERIRLADHLATCDSCAGLLRDLVAFAESEGREWEVHDGPGRHIPVVVRRSRWAGGTIARIAALILIAAALLVVYTMPFPAVESGASGRWRGPAPRLEAAISWPVQNSDPVVTWDQWPGASSYRIRVWSEDGEKLLERHVAAGEPRRLSLSISEAQEGDPVFWEVDALETGDVVASTGPKELHWVFR